MAKFDRYPKKKLQRARAVFEFTEPSKVPSIFWIQRSGDIVYITDLRQDHLERIVAMFEANPNWRKLFQPAIYGEVDRRKKQELIKRSKAGKILYANS